MADIEARYRIDAEDGAWTDMPEARPRCRAMIKKGSEEVTIDSDGTMHLADNSKLIIDTYDGPEYADVRAEGERRWKIKRKAKE